MTFEGTDRKFDSAFCISFKGMTAAMRSLFPDHIKFKAMFSSDDVVEISNVLLTNIANNSKVALSRRTLRIIEGGL